MKEKETPLEQLRARREQLRFESQIQQDKISANIKYVQNNGGKLAWHSIKSAILPGKSGNKQTKPSTLPLSLTDFALSGVTSAMRGGKMGVMPMVWSIAQPFVLTWGLKGAKKLIGGLFSRKKKKKKK